MTKFYVLIYSADQDDSIEIAAITDSAAVAKAWETRTINREVAEFTLNDFSQIEPRIRKKLAASLAGLPGKGE